MQILRRTLGLLLVFSLTTQGVFAQSVDGDVTVKQNPPGTPAGVLCSTTDQIPNPINGVCCVGLEKNALGKCDVPPFVDPSLKTCTSSSDCTGGTGCYPQSNKDLFSGLSPSPESVEVLNSMKLEVEAQINEVETIYPAGGSCIHSRDCASYSCIAGVCENKQVCRYAGKGEVAAAGVSCGRNLVRTASGACDLSAEAKHGVFIGLLGDVKIKNVDNKCQFELDPEVRKRSIIAMKSLRAMEWFFATISLAPNEECFDIMPTLKYEIGTSLVETRKAILSGFTDTLNGIEDDYVQLFKAKEKDPTMTTIHIDENISKGDLATRQTSGYDGLIMMKRRNILFQSYEKLMLEAVGNAHEKLIPLAQRLAGLESGTPLPSCEASKYKTKKPFRSWKTSYYESVKDQWANHYEVTGSAPENANIMRRPKVANVMSLLSGKTVEESITEFTRPIYYLMDPMLFGGMKDGQYGENKPLKKKSSFLGLFGGFQDLRKASYLRGTGTGSYTKMYSDLKPSLREFVKSMKTTAGQKKFVYDPELLETSAKDCLGANPEKCEPFGPYLDDILDETFAHFIAFSYATTDSYDGYFENATTYRRRLMNKLEVDMQNITKYYETVIKNRDDQNECIERVIGGIKKTEILVADESGVIEGDYHDDNIDNNGSGANGTKSVSNPSTATPLNRSKYGFNLKGNTLTSLSSGGKMDNVLSIGTTGSRAGMSDSASAMLAARKKAMLSSNSKASKMGVNLAEKEKAVKDSMNALTKNHKSGTGSSSASGFGSSSALGSGFGSSNPGSASVSTSPLSGSAPVTGVGVSADTASIDLSAGKNSYGSGYGEGPDANGVGSMNNKMGGGGNLTDTERENMLSEYERNKDEYQGAEDDGIFAKVSKAYVRNLDKVLTKKKKLD